MLLIFVTTLIYLFFCKTYCVSDGTLSQLFMIIIYGLFYITCSNLEAIFIVFTSFVLLLFGAFLLIDIEIIVMERPVDYNLSDFLLGAFDIYFDLLRLPLTIVDYLSREKVEPIGNHS
jgi:hypothetical protein